MQSDSAALLAVTRLDDETYDWVFAQKEANAV